MDAPVLAEDADDTYRFFLSDTSHRLTRLVECALGYGGFAILLYCKLLWPGGAAVWQWAAPAALWVLVFVPLFLLDWRNYLHYKYLRRNHGYFAPHDAKRYALISLSELLYKVLLCLHLAFVSLRAIITVKFTMFMYAFGYISHFVIGHFVPLESDFALQEDERAEGCNVMESLLSDVGRFLSFVLVVSLSLKVDGASHVGYDWQAAFWPCWGLEGILTIAVVLLLPVLVVSVIWDRRRTLMIAWSVAFGAGFGVASFMSMYNLAVLLDGRQCPEPYDSAAAAGPRYAACRRHLDLALCPWLALLPIFSGSTLLLRRKLAVAFHEAWYQPGRGLDEDLGAHARPGATAAAAAQLPSPEIMFRVTATYYSRTCDLALPAGDALSSVGRPATPTSLRGPPPVGRALAPNFASFGSELSRTQRGAGPVDPSSSILSLRGSNFGDIVESEQLCFICYDRPPRAILLECGHAGLCEECASHLLDVRHGQAAQCPICRSQIFAVMRMRGDLPLPAHLFVQPAHLRHAGTSAAASANPAQLPAGSSPGFGAQPPSPLLGAASVAPGPPWPLAAKSHAVAVEAVRLHRQAGRWRAPSRQADQPPA